jgi:prevent-host-death family protein
MATEKRRARSRNARPKLPVAHDRRYAAEIGGRRTIAAAKFKPVCLRLMDQVHDTGVEIVITKHNRPIAKLVPITDDDLTPFVGRSRGVINVSREDLLAPIDQDWEVDADL